MKQCSICGIIKSSEDYYKNLRTRDGLYSCCKQCHIKYAYKWSNNHLKKRREYQKKWYDKHGKLYEYEYRKRNPEKGQEKQRRWARSVAGVLKCRLRAAKRRHRLSNILHAFTLGEWQIKLNATNGICPICHKLIGIDNFTIDHIIPISRAPNGYKYTINDVQPLCRSCNSSKGNR